MSWAGCQTSLPPYVCRSLVMACLLLVCFFVYFSPDVKLPSFNFHMERGDPPDCPSDPDPDPTVLLIWMWPFGYKNDLDCSTYGITRCKMTVDRSLYHKAHGVIFHHWDINPGDMPKEPRPWFQKWVWFNMESPSIKSSGPIQELQNSFNLTCNFRFDSDIPMRYGYLEPLRSEVESFKPPAKEKLVSWIVSNWNPSFKRVQFYNELKKHINISTYGGGFSKRVNEDDYWKIVSGSKFYLSFENSVHKDYITEKLYRPMLMGSVPVVLGPSRSNYEDHVPGDSFIHIDDFSTPKELAERLLYLDQNNSEYMRYFDWRKRFHVRMSVFGKEQACGTCGYLQKHREYKAFHDLKKWYWG